MLETNQVNKGGTRIKSTAKKSSPNLPLVSIITVVFNGELALEETIQSVLKQSYPNIEYIIIDGASRDRTLEIIRQYEAAIDYWCSEPDAGIYDAMNKGIQAAQGQIIGLINCGDIYLENAIAEIVNIYNQHSQTYPLLVMTGAMYRFDPENNYQFRIAKTQELLNNKINRGMPLNHPATFITKTIYEQLGLFNTKYKICGDYDLIFRLYNNSLVKFVFTNRELANMQLGGISEQLSSIGLRCREHFKIRKNHLSLLPNLWICGSFYLITLTKFTIKKIISNSLIFSYYNWRHK